MGQEPRADSYCSNCGRSLTASMNFCPSCGVEIGNTPTESRSTRTGSTRVSDREVLQYRIDRALEAGWELEHDLGESAVVVRRSLGSAWDHVLVAILTFWWTGGVGNALYAAYCYFVGFDRVVLRPEGATLTGATAEPATESGGQSLALAVTVGGLWLGGAVLVAIGLSTGVAAGWGLALFGLCFVLLGASVIPGVRSRLAERHSLLTNGRVRSVDERVINAPETPCSACFDRVGRGVERTYREEFALLGVPLTREERENRYCRACANGEHTSPPADRTEPDRERSAERI